MGDSLITVISILLVAVLMFVFPMMSVAERTDDMSQLAVQNATVEFVNNIRETGKLKQSDYNSFLQKLSSTGNSYEVEMEHKVLDENPSKKVTWTESKKIGENVYYSEYKSQLEEKLENSGNGEISFNEGDIISVNVKNTNTTMGQILKNFFYTVTGSGTSQVQASHAGIVMLNGTD